MFWYHLVSTSLHEEIDFTRLHRLSAMFARYDALILMDLKIPMVVEVVSRAVGLNLPLLQSDLRPA